MSEIIHSGQLRQGDETSDCCAAVRQRWTERGMATAEYAVGILAAVALALVLLKVFNDNAFFSILLKVVVGIIGKISGML